MNIKFLWVSASITLLVACSKKSSSGTPPPPTPATGCGTKSECILGSWFIFSSNARLNNGLVVSLYSKANNTNLLDFEKWNWVFTSDGKWTEYLHGGILNDTGPYVINKDTLFTKGKFPHTFIVSSITKSDMSGYFVFDHAKPDTLTVRTALSVNIDTANLNNMTAEWNK